MQLSKQFEFQRWLAAAVEAGVDAAIVESSAIDCQSFDRILVTLDIGKTATQNGTVKFYLEECATSDGTYAAISGATIGTHKHGATGETAKTYLIDAKISKRYVKIVYQRETQNTELAGGIALLYAGKEVPTDQSADLKEMVVI
jgi:hypothetical protein